MVERRDRSVVHDVVFEPEGPIPTEHHGVVLSTSTFHLRWVEYLEKRRERKIGGLRVG